MALQLPYFQTEHGVEVEEAYCRIDTFRGDRTTVRLGVGIYVSADARQANKPAITQLEFILPTPNTEANMFAAAYAWLKTQPQFAEAVDA